MEKLCLHCGGVFSGMPHYLKERRFCSKPCWYAWHKGPNNSQTRRVSVVCDGCGTSFDRQPRKVREKNYCTPDCAHAHHGVKIRGEKHGHWKGGVWSNRGPSWGSIRLDVLRRQDFLCESCGMSNETHKERFRVGLHVHHRSPYRLHLSNDPGNLVALCARCHSLEEAAVRRSLSAADFDLMRQNTEAMREKGLPAGDSSHLYDACPECEGRKAKKALLCRRCGDRAKIARRPANFFCPKCGNGKSVRATLCRGCELLRRSGASV